MNVELKNELIITDYSDDEAEQIKSSLTLQNPNWITALSLGKSIFGIDQKLRFYHEENGKLFAPVGFLSDLLQITPNAVITDNRYSAPPIKIKFIGTLYDYQSRAVEAMLSVTSGCLCSNTGTGKTAMACAMIAKLKQPTLILVDTIELLNQFASRLKTFTSLKNVGIIGQGKKDIKPITVATLQTLNRWTVDELQSLKFGVVFCDECHIAPALTYYRVISNINAKYKYGLSATPERADGLTKVIFFATGPLTHSVPDSDVIGKIIKPTYQSIESNYFYPLFDSMEYNELLSDMAVDSERNRLIVDTVNKFPTQQMCLLCHRKTQVKLLASMLPGAAVLLSDTPKKERIEIMKTLEDGTRRIVVTTWGLFHKGIDLKELEILFLCAPTKSKILLKQSAGRIMRVSNKIDKHPLIIDFIDTKIDLLKYQAYARRKVLTRL